MYKKTRFENVLGGYSAIILLQFLMKFYVCVCMMEVYLTHGLLSCTF